MKRLARNTALLFIVTLTVLAPSITACDFETTCPMHHFTSRATGKQKYTDGGQRHWAEYKCPGGQYEGPHTFWVECQ
jgi:hypothetical protein